MIALKDVNQISHNLYTHTRKSIPQKPFIVFSQDNDNDLRHAVTLFSSTPWDAAGLADNLVSAKW